MSYLQNALEALNERYTEITDLVPNKYFFSDEREDTADGKFFGIDDGGDDMYDGANLIDTDLTQDWADVQDNDGIGIDSIPITHTPAPNGNFDDDYTSPPMDGVVSDGTPYFGAGSEYVTNMYPALWVMMADMISVNQFSIWGNIGADGGGEQEYDVATLLGGQYTLFYKSVYDANDPTINHMIIVPGGPEGITHNVPPGTSYDDHNLTGISDRPRIFYLLTAKGDDTALGIETAVEVSEKFLEIVGVGGGPGRLTVILPVLKLRALAFDPLTFVSQLQPDSNIQNIIGQLESREIWLPFYDRSVRHGEEITLYGQQAIKARQVLDTMNSDGNAVVEVLYYGSNPPSEEGETYTSDLTSKPSWLGFYPTDYKNTLDTDYGFDGGGMWLVGDAGTPAYPIRTEFPVPADKTVTVTVDFLHSDVDGACPDQSVAVFSDSQEPSWNWGQDSSRISFQVDCGEPELEGTTMTGGFGFPNLTVGETYRVVFTYDPSSGATASVYGPLPSTAQYGLTMEVFDTLPPGPYRVGFDADLDSSLPDKSYFSNLTIVVS